MNSNAVTSAALKVFVAEFAMAVSDENGTVLCWLPVVAAMTAPKNPPFEVFTTTEGKPEWRTR